MGELHNTYIDSACNYIVHALNALGNLMDRRHTTLNRTLIVIASVFALVALMGAASATDYYVATWGDNTAQGDITHPWQNVSYATQQAVAGDTIYLFDGTWYNEACTFANSGNATHRVTLTAYNGTPTMVGDSGATAMVGISVGSYTTVSHLMVRNYTHTITVKSDTNHTIISDCDLGYTGGTNYGYVVAISRGGSKHNTIQNCNIHNAGWNSIQLIGNREPPNGNGIPSEYITVRNCTIHASHAHTAIDFFGNLEHVLIEDCELYDCTSGGIYAHNHPDWRNNITVRNNVFHNLSTYSLRMVGIGPSAETSNLSISGNTFRDLDFTDPIVLKYAKDVYIYNNDFINSTVTCGRIYKGTSNITFDRNYIGPHSKAYDASYGGKMLVRNPSGKVALRLQSGSSFGELEWDDGTVFVASPAISYSSWTPVRYYPDKSNCSLTSTSDRTGYIDAVTAYSCTLRPTTGHLYDVTVDTWDEATDTYRITASSTVPDNPTWINLTTKAASATYDITRAGADDIKATTSADGVLRYHYDETWDGPETFEISYDSDAADPSPLVTDLRNDLPTPNGITLVWGCSVSDVDYYAIYQDGTLLDTTEDQYYIATNLLPDTAYTFDVSATNKGGITGDSVSITVRTAADDFGSNTLRIADDVTASPGSYVTVPIMIYDATGVACDGVNLTYDASVVNVISVTQGDFTTYFGFDDGSAADGWVTVNTYVSETSLTGDVKIADVTLKAVGDVGDTSPLDMEIIAMTDQNGHPVSGTVSNGLFTVVSDTNPPIVLYLSASQLIPDDTDGVPSWGETATLNVTVTDESDIARVTIDLSAIGGSPVQPMTHIGCNVWSVTTNASAGTPPRAYNLLVCATDIHGYTNMQESVELVVMRNGDVSGDNDVTLEDVSLMENYVTYPGRYTISSEFVADVSGDGVVNIVDAMMLANYVVNPYQHPIRGVDNTC